MKLIARFKASVSIWTPLLGETLEVGCKDDNNDNEYTVATTRREGIVGHVLREISRVCAIIYKAQQSLFQCISLTLQHLNESQIYYYNFLAVPGTYLHVLELGFNTVIHQACIPYRKYS